MLFFDPFSSVLPCSTVIDLAKYRQRRRFALLTTTSVSIYKFDMGDPRMVGQFDSPPSFQSHGLFIRCHWISVTQLAVLTTLGRVVICKASKHRFRPDFVITPTHSTQFLALSSHAHCLVVGDSDGDLLFFSPTFEVLLRAHVCDLPIKQVAIASALGVVATGDSHVLSFDLPSDRPPTAITTQDTTFVASIIAVSEIEDVVALYHPTGLLMVTNFRQIAERAEVARDVSAVTFCSDGMSLVFLCPGTVCLWNLRYRRLTHFAKPECVGCRSVVCTRQLLIVAAVSGVYSYPVLAAPAGRIPLLFAASRVVEYRATTRGIVELVHDVPDFGHIRFAAADGLERFIAIATESQIGLISRRSMKFIRVTHEPLQIRAIEWLREHLVVVSAEELKVYQAGTGLTMLKSLA
jgi:hypothetical protein